MNSLVAPKSAMRRRRLALIFLALPSGYPLIAGAAEAPVPMDVTKIPMGHAGDCAACHGKQRPNTYVFDSKRSLVVAQFHGVGVPIPATVEQIRGGFTFDVAALQNSRVTVEMDAAAVKSSDGLVSDFVHSSQFLDSQRYPLIRFVSTSIRKKTDNTFAVGGNLTLHGITVPSELEATFDGGGGDPLLANTYATFHASGNLRCRDFGITLCAPSDSIHLDIFVSGRATQ